MHLPKFSELADEQMDVYLHPPDESLLVVGPPGSGKTSMAIWRGRVLTSPPYGLAVLLITKNRLLAAMAGTLALEESGSSLPTATMHSFVWHHYRNTFGGIVPKVSDYDYDWGLILQEYTAAGIEPQLDHIIIDEGQNLPFQFFIWATQFAARRMSIFADEHQTTDHNSTTIQQLAALGFTQVFPLLLNHRNTAKIAELVGAFHIDRVIPQASPRRGLGSAPLLLRINSWDELAELVANRYHNRRETVGVIVYEVVEVEHMLRLVRELLPGARVDSYTNRTPRGAELMIKMREPGVTILSGQSAIGLEFDTLYLQDLSRSLPVTEASRARRLYMLCARARDNLFLIDGPIGLTPTQLADLPLPPVLER